MLGGFRSMGLYAKVAILGGGSVLITASALLALAFWQSDVSGDLAQKEADKLIGVDLDHIALGIYNLVAAQDEALTYRLGDRLAVVERLTEGAGTAGPPKGRLYWRDAGFTSLYRHSADGRSLICVASDLKNKNGRSAVGTKIGPLDEDKRPSPLLQALARKEAYFGELWDANGRFYVGAKSLGGRAGGRVAVVGIAKEEAEASVRRIARSSRLGTSGYVFVLEATGPDRGKYIVSKDGRRDGENIWRANDWEGHFVAREVIAKAMSQPPGKLSIHRYKWMNPGDAAPNYKIARLTYYPRWNWVIGAGITEGELLAFDQTRRQGLSQMTLSMALTGLVITLLIVAGSIRLAWTLVNPVRRLRSVVEQVTAGNLDQEVPVESKDEIGALAESFNYMTGMLRTTIQGLEVSEARYRGVVENAVEGIFTSSVEGRLLAANPALATMVGCPSPEAAVEIYQDIGSQFYADPTSREQLLKLVFEKGSVMGYETQVKRMDGSVFWASLSVQAFKDERGRPRTLEGFVVDITERKTAQEVLEDERRLFIAGPNVAFRWRYAPGWPVTYVSPNVEEQFGYTVEELTSEGFLYSSIMHPDDLKRVGGEVEAFSQSGADWFEQEYRIARKDGEYRWIYDFTTVVRDHEGEVSAYQGHITDITESKKASEELKSSEARLRLLNEIDRSILGVESPVGIARSAIGKIRNVFQCDFAAVTFYDGEQHIVGAFDCEGGIPNQENLVWPACDKHVEMFRRGEAVECDDLAAIDERCPVEQMCLEWGLRSRLVTPMTSPEGLIGVLVLASKPIRAFGPGATQIARELSTQLAIAVMQARLHEQVQRHAVELERRVAERTDELAAANRELESFSYSVSHDLRAPLRSIDGFSRIVVEDYGERLPAEALDYLRRVTEATERMGKLIDDLLQLSRLTRTKLQVVEVDLSGIAAEIAVSLQQEEPKRKVQFLIQPGLKALGDPSLLQALMGNLIENAWKYTSKHKKAKIEFGAANEDGVTTYYVRDDGAGFDMAYADKLFGAFQRLHSPNEFPGTGIGLAGVNKIVNRHGGKIWAEGAPEKGATFYFTLAAWKQATDR